LERFLPKTISTDQCVGDIIHPDAPAGLKLILQAEVVRGTAGMKARPLENKVASFGVQCWDSACRRLYWMSQRCKHWKVTNMDYRDLPNPDATWFVDPPYNNKAGGLYKHNHTGIDYAELGQWCLNRQGHLIVCENTGADWLPFVFLNEHRGLHVISKTSSVVKNEVIYCRSKSSLPL
jgi:16S rRNA G966 N2-methylase RsmD